ncbi:MAG: aromatic ring-hydroxylating dioxygenase subunit alpha [Novosphingobium sp.]|nr:aromatic ring-hydroxylating dioxygenase subunit alpha [Novosphingobium sp.]
MAGYLRNAWYVGAWSDEVGRAPLGRKLLGQPVVFYRKQDGTLVAMKDRCPHRFVPLSLGEVDGDEIKCGYHGLTFDSRGNCTSERADCAKDAQFAITTYPVVDMYKAVWIWMGDPALADPSLIPDFSFFDDPGRVVISRGLTHVKSNYQLEADNLLDLTHVDTIHRNTIANVPMTRIGEYKVSQVGNTVHSNWTIHKSPPPAQYVGWIAASKDPVWDGRRDGDMELWIDVRWDPGSNLIVNAGIGPAGMDREGKIEVLQGHFITPETETTTHYFWSNTLPDLGISQEDMDMFHQIARRAFEDEDRPMIEAQQEAMGDIDFWAHRPMILKEDAGAIRARRILDKLLREEAQAGHAPQELAAAE